ncbi:unnamed protein product [Rotaria sp. Silwood1]|nr:unnamed protein product [Rotaria sp. Silwood1]CAF3743777.1 unnamed protein product [Rotaria sp. Silwood1]CAF3761533.1 unnamed protein product [Rotaria sp. Silwood1]CAF4891840.1 unnamed protein product [Rotaria sp. Silwood1]CAF5001617.1 unnamed protein product [Rotaria sp. Silwood1]
MKAVSIWWLLIVVNKIIYLANAYWLTGNLCWSMPCLNGGSCFGSAYTYLCICPINYTGALCEKRLGICQENPCGNRGLCIEKNLTSFECRCYFDYMGPTCEEHVSKTVPNIWSSLLPAHTRILFDMLKEAYRAKPKQKSSINSGNDHIDFIGLLNANESIRTTSIPMTSTSIEPNLITHQNELTSTEHVIQAKNIRLERIFPNMNIASTVEMNTYEFTEESFPYDYSTTFLTNSEIDITSTPMIIDNMTTTEIEQIQPTSLNPIEDQDSINVTEQLDTIITSTSMDWLNNNYNIIDDITTENSFEQTKSFTEFIDITTIEPMDYTSSNADVTIDDYDASYTSDQMITSSINTSELPSSTQTTTIIPTTHSQFLYKLCRQILSHLLPNTSSSTVTASTLPLTSHSSSKSDHTTDKFLSWISKYLSSSKSTSTSSTVPSLFINDIRTSSIPLQRIDMDDVLHHMNNNKNINNEQ